VLARTALTVALISSMGMAQAENLQPLQQEGRQIAKEFLGQLKPELKKAMKSGGPAHAIEVCYKKAPQIAAELSEKTGWQLKRTSLKVRNPNNAPDEWEKQVLQRFEQQKAQGTDPKTLEYVEVIEENGQKVFRYAKAIPTGKVCLVCHGTQVSEPLLKKIRSYYPEDQATGFQPGDIRGIFSFKKAL